MSTESEPLRQAVSDAKMAANRANSLKSCGPKTPAGKAVSRGNALKHGLCAQTIALPDENGELFETRYDAWSRELNPLASEAAAYLVAQLVRKSIRLDRCHLVHDATAADLARDAARARAEGRSRQVEELSRLLLTDPDIAVRRLRDFPEGCDYLIQEWEQLAPTLIEPTHWDDDDEANAGMLLGRIRTYRQVAPGQLRLATLALVEHRRVAEKLRLNEDPDLLDWTQKYKSALAHERDREKVLGLELRAIQAKDEVEKRIAREIAGLRARKLELEEVDRVEASEATLRARFDDTDRGKLLHRHEVDLERGFQRGMKELREFTRWTMQMASIKEVAPERPWDGVRPPAVKPARNEATGVAKGGPLSGWEPVENTGYSEVDVAITPRMGPKRRQ
jgi:hypothetical protein